MLLNYLCPIFGILNAGILNNSSKQNRIKITRTSGEFILIDETVKASGKPDMNTYLRFEIRKLTKQFNICPECVIAASGEKIEKVHYVPKEEYAVLLKISDIMKKPISSIIDDFFICPLLAPKIINK